MILIIVLNCPKNIVKYWKTANIGEILSVLIYSAFKFSWNVCNYDVLRRKKVLFVEKVHFLLTLLYKMIIKLSSFFLS